MLTRLKVSGFKNLVDVDVAFGPFTCIAGANGVGKSNLFDAIRFLSVLADSTLIDAARIIRDDTGKNWDVRSLFHQVGKECSGEMSFEAEMIIPASGRDPITQSMVTATSTFLRYRLVLTYDTASVGGVTHPLRIAHESLEPISRGEAPQRLRFPRSKEWSDSVLQGRRTVAYVSTPEGESNIHLHQDKQAGTKGGGRSFQHPAANLTRSVISLTNSSETPTALLAKREMQSCNPGGCSNSNRPHCGNRIPCWRRPVSGPTGHTCPPRSIGSPIRLPRTVPTSAQTSIPAWPTGCTGFSEM